MMRCAASARTTGFGIQRRPLPPRLYLLSFATDGVQVDALVPRLVPAQEELQACRWIARERGIFGTLLVELLCQLAIPPEHLARNLLCYVRFDVLLLFEVSVEEAPRGERVRCLRFEQRNDQSREPLGGWHDQRAARNVERLNVPRSFQLGAKTALEWDLGEGNPGCPESLYRRVPDDALHALEADSVQVELGRHDLGVGRGHDVGVRYGRQQTRLHPVAERNAPDLRRLGIVGRHQCTRDGRDGSRVRVTAEVDQVAFIGCRLGSVLADLAGLSPARRVVQGRLGSDQASGIAVGALHRPLPRGAM